VVAYFADLERLLFPTRVAEAELVASAQRRKRLVLEEQHGAGFLVSRSRRSANGDAGGRGDPADVVLRRLPGGDVLRARDGAGANLRPGEVHQQATVLAGLGPRVAERLHHPQPLVGTVVRAVDAKDVHACPQHLGHPRPVGLLGRRRRDHDVDVAIVRPGTEHLAGVLVKGLRGRFPGERSVALSGEPLQLSLRPGISAKGERLVDAPRRLEQAPAHPALGAPQRRDPELRELELEIAKVVLAERDVPDEVPGALAAVVRHALDRAAHLAFELGEGALEVDKLLRHAGEGGALLPGGRLRYSGLHEGTA
jgi:hypothetical protein